MPVEPSNNRVVIEDDRTDRQPIDDRLELPPDGVPLAPLGVWLGHWLVKRSEPAFYYRVISVFLVVLGVILIIRSLSGQSH